YADNPQRTSVPEMFRVRPNHAARRDAALAALQDAVQRVLTPAALNVGAVDAFLLQQPSGRRLDRMVRLLDLHAARVICVAEDRGASGSACIPPALDRLMRTRPPRAGARLLFAGTGGGGGAGAVLYRVAPAAEAKDASRKEAG